MNSTHLFRKRSAPPTNRPAPRRLTAARVGLMLVGFWTVTGAAMTALNLQPLQVLELQTQAFFFRLRGEVAPPKEIVILAMDDESMTKGQAFQELKELEPIRSWPWQRTAYATAIARLMEAGAKAVSVDLVFDQVNAPADDQRLQQILKRYPGRITLAAMHVISQDNNGNSLEQLVYPAPLFQPVSSGFINFLPEVDDQLRRFSHIFLNQLSPELQQTQAPLLGFDQASLKAARLPSAPPKGDYIFFYGGQGRFQTVSFWNVLDTTNWNVLKQQQVFKDKLVLIGPTDALSQDFQLTPFGKIPGVEVHASAIATRLEGRAIAEVLPNAAQRGIIIFFALASIGLGLKKLLKRSTGRFLVALGVAATWLGAGYLCFTYGGWILPIVVPTMAIVLSGLSYLITEAVSDQLEKLRLRRTLERYVAAPVVQEILSQPEDFQTLLQGRKLNAAVLFCDIRGFTTLSYKLPAEQLVTLLNTYLDAMVGAIITARGTIDKFIGDAVMAEFGCPVSQGEAIDAMSAIRAALGMRQALAHLRQQWQQSGEILLYHGIGISYGEVIAGNVGSLQRLEYTVIGDAANVASRVESLTKDFCTDILITGPLFDLVEQEIDAVFVGEHRLRGRDSATRLYSLIGLKGEDPKLYLQVREELRRYLGFKEFKES